MHSVSHLCFQLSEINLTRLTKSFFFVFFLSPFFFFLFLFLLIVVVVVVFLQGGSCAESWLTPSIPSAEPRHSTDISVTGS